ncbi:hypothetical protein [Acidimangrovimonas pyrenivorans]|uniref:RDD family protein n=1 Tax=Acidimangrovimonas pyrenivorans TaxID=2030798 RepID=A0ABV7AJX1_9RHOB
MRYKYHEHGILPAPRPRVEWAMRTGGRGTGAGETGAMTTLSNRMAMGKSLAELTVFSALIDLLLLVTPIHLLQVYDRIIPLGSIESLVYVTR